MINFLEEAQGILSMIRWAFRMFIWIYLGATVIFGGMWIADSVIKILNDTTPAWTWGIAFISTTGGFATAGGILKVYQKKFEVDREKTELYTNTPIPK